MRQDPMFFRRYPMRPAIHFRYKADLDGNPLNPPTADNQTAAEWPRLRPRTRGNGSGGKSPRTK